MRHAAAVQHVRTLNVLYDVRARLCAAQRATSVDQVASGELLAEAIDTIGNNIVVEVAALNALDATAEAPE